MWYTRSTTQNKSTSNLEHLQHSDANEIIVHPSKLLIIVHDFYTLRKALIAIIATVQLFENYIVSGTPGVRLQKHIHK